MPRLLLAVLVACLAVASAGRPQPLSPRFSQIKARAQAKVSMLPHESQGFKGGLDYALPKYTPGDACGTKTECNSCLVNQVCVWLPFGNKCVEDRDPAHMAGTMQCGSWTPDLLPVISNEHDDYRLFHTRGDPRDFNIASLKGGQDMYGKAVDVEGPAFTSQDSNLATMGGGEILEGLTHDAFEGNTLQHDNTGAMLPLGAKGVESDKPCECKQKFAAKPCDCAFPHYQSGF